MAPSEEMKQVFMEAKRSLHSDDCNRYLSRMKVLVEMDATLSGYLHPMEELLDLMRNKEYGDKNPHHHSLYLVWHEFLSEKDPVVMKEKLGQMESLGVHSLKRYLICARDIYSVCKMIRKDVKPPVVNQDRSRLLVEET